MTEAEQVMKRCQIGTRNYEEANNLHADCYRVIGKLLAEKSMREVQRLGQEIEQEPVAWRNAAIRVGEDLSSVGPDGYYDMTAQQWLDWAMEQQPHGKNSLAQPEQEPVAHCKVRPLRGDESFPKVEIDWVNQPVPGPLYTQPPQRNKD